MLGFGLCLESPDHLSFFFTTGSVYANQHKAKDQNLFNRISRHGEARPTTKPQLQQTDGGPSTSTS